MSRRRVSNPLALAVLACLSERPMHPYEISSTLRYRGKEESIKLNYGSLYAVVGSLTKHGLIEPRATEREGRRPERTTYAITPAGVEEFEDWLAELLSTPTKEYPALEAALSLMAGLPPDEVARLLEQRAGRLGIELTQLEAARQTMHLSGLPRLFWVESEYHHAIIAAERDYVSRLAADIRSGELEGVVIWRRMHELLAQGITSEELFTEPEKYVSEEDAHWLRGELPPQPG